jgi:trans-2,3-dihydro-3-hydroxyanthranilate isomerase
MTVSDRTVIPDSVDWLGPAEQHRYVVVDVFTPRALEGNQLGVFLDGRSFSAEQMQALARELKFAETVFLLPAVSGGDVRVRIFTPGIEMPFAGHPVLGTAFVVALALGRQEVTLETGAGPVSIALEYDGDRIAFGRMKQPIPTWEPYERREELLTALGVEASLLPVDLYRNGPEHVYVMLESEQAVASLRPDMSLLEDLAVGANCFAASGSSVKTRMFFPAAGVPEDAATGSAAGPLAMHLARHGRIGFGDTIEIRQGEAIKRPSLLYAKVTGTAERIESVEVGGQAQIVAEGRFRIES